MLEPENEHREELNIFCRALRRTPEDVEYEIDNKHAEVLMERCEVLSAKAVKVSTAVSKEEQKYQETFGPRRFRAVAARINNVVADKPDVYTLHQKNRLGPRLVTGEVFQEQR